MEAPEYDRKKGLSTFDRLILRGAKAGKSPNEISDLTNGVIKPEVVAVRILEILDGRDWLSEAHQRMLLTDEIMELKDVLTVKAVEYGSIDHTRELIKVLTLIDKRLADNKFDLQSALTQISRAQSQLLLSGISLALERSFLELEKRYPEMRKAELLEIFHQAMPDAVREIESRVTA
ncbi:hypothetical protein [Frigoribacterium sp. UYMn621]|uniref:hypothetical protein n=1 Tax=Frigoribacterium sp. UYMn621 TaxID=3156343 RepID=UPI00339304B9